MDPQSTPQPAAAPQRRHVPLVAVLAAAGIVAILASLAVRDSSWAHERALKSLNLEDLTLAVHDDPHDSLTLLYYGTALLSAGRAQEAETTFEQAANLNPPNEGAERGLGDAELKLNKLPEALEAFQNAIRLNPKDADAYRGLAQTYSRQGDASLAAQQMKRAVDLNPQSAATWYSLSKIYADSQNSASALDALSHAIKLDGNQGAYWRDLGELLSRSSRLDEAEESLKKAVQLSPGDGRASLELGQLYLQMGDTPGHRHDAEKCFEASIAIDPRMEGAYIGLGTVHQRSAEYQPAIDAFQKANALNPSDGHAIQGLGECLVSVGNFREGKRLLAAASKLAALKKEVDTLRNKLTAEPQSREVRLQLARMFRKHGNYSEALNQYAAYQNLGAEDPAVRKEIEKCQAEEYSLPKGNQSGSLNYEPANNVRR